MDLFSGFLGTKEERFWKWFVRNSTSLLASRDAEDSISNRLGEELKRVDSRFVFEFSVPKENQKKEFTISVDGMSEAIQPAIRLFNARPNLDNWDFKLFRQRSGKIFNIKMNGLEIKGEDSRFLLVKDEDKSRVGILLFYSNFQEELRQEFGNISYIYLDNILGEYEMMTRVGLVDVFGFESEYYQESRPFIELISAFDEVISQIGSVR